MTDLPPIPRRTVRFSLKNLEAWNAETREIARIAGLHAAAKDNARPRDEIVKAIQSGMKDSALERCRALQAEARAAWAAVAAFGDAPDFDYDVYVDLLAEADAIDMRYDAARRKAGVPMNPAQRRARDAKRKRKARAGIFTPTY